MLPIYHAEFWHRPLAVGTSVIKEIRLKRITLASRLSRSCKVTGTDRDRSATYDFPLTFRSNHGPISYRFRDKRRFHSKIANVPTSMYFAPPLKGFPLELGNGARNQKLEGRRYQSDKEVWRYLQPSAWIQCTNVSDGQTDGWTDTGLCA